MPRDRLHLAGLTLFLGLAACGQSNPTPAQAVPPYMPKSVFWQPLPDNPEIDPQSATYIADMLTGSTKGQLDINTTSYNVPVFQPPTGTPEVTVQIAMTYGVTLGPVPIPSTAQPATGTDGEMDILDLSNNTSYEFYQAQQSGSTWSAAIGLAFDTREDGINRAGTGIRATSLSLLLGNLTYDEIAGGGPIQHALAWNNDRVNSQYYTAPATSGDGNQAGVGGPLSVPEGARVQLDPSLDVTTLGLSATGQRIAKALQQYGMFLLDASSDSTLIAESLNGTSKSWDGILSYNEVQAIPADRFRVLKLQNQIRLP